MTLIWQEISVLLVFVSAGAMLAGGVPVRRLIGVLVVLFLAFVPLGESNAWLWMKGLIGNLSVVSLALLGNYLLMTLTGRQPIDRSSRTALYSTILISGLLLYPATLGLSMYDPYRLGFGILVAMAVLALALLAWITGRQGAAVVLVTVVLADQAGAAVSLNTWDYLLDPLVWIISPVMLWRLRPRS